MALAIISPCGAALIPLLVILVQAGVYWLLARGFNYFVIRLSYPVNQWFTRVGKRNVPQLVQDFSVDSKHRSWRGPRGHESGT